MTHRSFDDIPEEAEAWAYGFVTFNLLLGLTSRLLDRGALKPADIRAVVESQLSLTEHGVDDAAATRAARSLFEQFLVALNLPPPSS